jgi:hypothetical protein
MQEIAKAESLRAEQAAAALRRERAAAAAACLHESDAEFERRLAAPAAAAAAETPPPQVGGGGAPWSAGWDRDFSPLSELAGDDADYASGGGEAGAAAAQFRTLTASLLDKRRARAAASAQRIAQLAQDRKCVTQRCFRQKGSFAQRN